MDCRRGSQNMILFFVFLYIFILGLLFPLGAQESAPRELDTKAGVLVLDRAPSPEAEEDAQRFADAVVASTRAAFVERGLTIDPKLLGARSDIRGTWETENQGAQIAGNQVEREAGARWVLWIRTALDGNRLFWRIGVYDAESGALLGADSYSTFAGLSALPVIDDSAKRVAQEWEKAKGRVAEKVELVSISQRFISPDPGVSIRFGTDRFGSWEGGTFSSRELSAAYVPFRRGQPVTVEVYREGYWSKEVTLPKGIQEKPVLLPRLQKKTQTAWGVNTGIGRLLGAALVYRWYPVPDRVFLKTENAVWDTQRFTPGSSPVLHDELRFGVGAYLQNRVDAAFRYSLGLGASAIGTILLNAPGYTVPAGIDLTFEPLWMTLEYHFPRWAIVFENRFPYSLGTGFLYPGWMSIDRMGPLFFSLGVLLKW